MTDQELAKLDIDHVIVEMATGHRDLLDDFVLTPTP